MKLFRSEVEIRLAIDTYCRPVQVGSRITCDPPPTDTDEDWLVWIERPIQEVNIRLVEQGFELGGSVVCKTDKDWKQNTFFSYVKGDLNLIVTGNRLFFDKFLEATKFAKQLNVVEKKDRVKLFQCLLYGVKTNVEFK